VYRRSSGTSFSGVLQGNAGGADSGAGRVLASLLKANSTWRAVESKLNLAQIYRRGMLYGYCSASDLWSFGPKGLLSTYRDHLRFHINPKSGVLSVHSNAYTAADSLAVLQRATAVAEQRLLRMHQQQSIAQLAQARHLVQTLTDSLNMAQKASNDYLQAQKSLYPSAEDAAALRLMNTLEAESARIAADRQALASGAPHSPMLGNLDAEGVAVQQRINHLQLQIPQLSAIFGHYSVLRMRIDSLQEQLKLANAAYVQAQIASVRPWYTLHVLSPAQKPLGPSGPDRKAWIFWALVGTLLLWSILR
jgi:capsule polysaccharide export protein KpsE/RkpR